MGAFVTLAIVLAAAGPVEGSLDRPVVTTIEVTSKLYADGNGGVTLRADTAGMLRSGDIIRSITLEPQPGAWLCQQVSVAEKRTGTRSCGFLNLQRCAVISSREQVCDVEARKCEYFVWRQGGDRMACTNDVAGTVVPAPMLAVPELRSDICRKPCDKGDGWRLKPNSTTSRYAPAGHLVGTVRYTIERSD